jgi:Na+/H+-dicarboxylate symporter
VSAKEGDTGLALHTKILIGLVLGALAAALVKSFTPPESGQAITDFAVRWIEPIGKLFLRGILLTVVPLVFTSIIGGIYQLGDIRTLGRLGTRTLGFYLFTSFAAASLATLFALTLGPGEAVSETTRGLLSEQFAGAANAKLSSSAAAAERFDGSFFQIVLNLVPDNAVAAMTSNKLLLEVIIFAVLLGASLTMIPKEKADPVAVVFEGTNLAMIKIIDVMMKLAPYGVFALVYMVVVRAGTDVLIALGYYTVIVVVCLLAHMVVVLWPLLAIFAKRSPIAFTRSIKEIWLTAFSTSSSSATLPTTMRVAEEEVGISKEVSSFVLPLGATINMDGTTIYQIIAVHFVAQVWGIEISLATSFSLILVAMLMGIGAAGVPGGVIPLLYVVMATAGIPNATAELGIALILGMDRILDMCRSCLNVVGDTITATVVAHAEGKLRHPERASG